MFHFHPGILQTRAIRTDQWKRTAFLTPHAMDLETREMLSW